jgi:hypothetical protein
MATAPHSSQKGMKMDTARQGSLEDRKFLIKRRYPRECVVCGEPATRRIAYLLRNARSNPASAGFGKDDISWCSDAEQFTCDEHEKNRPPTPDGMEWCSTFDNGKRFAHMFFEWSEKDITPFMLSVDRLLQRLEGSFGGSSDSALPGEYDSVRLSLNALLSSSAAGAVPTHQEPTP